MNKTDNGIKWPERCFKCFKLVTKSSLPMSSQVMKIGSINFEPVKKFSNKIWASKHSKRPIIARRSLSARKLWYSIFFSGVGVTIKVPMENGKKHHRKALLRHSTGEAEKNYQKRRPVTGFKHIRLLHGNVPALASKIVTAFWKKEKVTVLPHLPYSLDLALCDFFMFSKLK